MRRVAFLVVALLGLALGGAAQAERRVALVIGNGSYQHAAHLPNAVNDGEDVAQALAAVGFEVVRGIDVDRAGLEEKVREFGRALVGADVSLFFYAGHGLQVAGANYIMPVDAKLEHEADLAFETVPVGLVLGQMERQTPLSLVFLDACRDNPLAQQLARSLGAARGSGVGQGLAEIRSGIGTLIAYSTAPDSIARDGLGRNSPFTAALLANLKTPGLEIRQLLTRVRQTVYEQSAGTQVPWDNSSLMGDFFFVPPPAPPAAPVQPVLEPAVVAVAPAPPAAVLPLAVKDELMWLRIQNSDNPADFQAYLAAFPGGNFVPLARSRLATLAAVPAPPSRAGGDPAVVVPAPPPLEEDPGLAACEDSTIAAAARLRECAALIGGRRVTGFHLARAYIARGAAEAELGSNERALADFNRAIEAAPTTELPYLVRATYYTAVEDLNRALRDFERAIGINPQSAIGYYGRAGIRAANGQHELALRDYDQAIRFGNTTGEVYNGRAWSRYVAGGDLGAALSDAEHAFRLLPDSYHVLDTRAHILTALGRDDEALPLFEQAMEVGGAELVRTYQALLVERGYNPGPIDGVYGSGTRRALAACLAAGCRLLE